MRPTHICDAKSFLRPELSPYGVRVPVPPGIEAGKAPLPHRKVHTSSRRALANSLRGAYHDRRGTRQMTKLSEKTSTEGRFARLLASTIKVRPLHDTPLLESEDWVAAPSLGALIPGWLIVLPRAAALNFQQWSRADRTPLSVLASVAYQLGLKSHEYIWFEHGPRAKGTTVGCGLDYAHLHILINPPFTFNQLVDCVRSDDRVAWNDVQADDVYSRSAASGSYFAIGHGSRAFLASDVEVAGSQYIRRAIANLVGLSDTWNYRAFPHHENIQKTVDLVQGLKDAARR